MGDPVILGGPAGIAAHVDDLFALTAVLRATSTAVGDAVTAVGAPAGGWPLLTSAVIDPAGSVAVSRALVALVATLRALADRLTAVGLALDATALSYTETEHAVGGWFHRMLTELSWGPGAVPPGLVAQMAGVPEDEISPLYALPRALAALMPDGRPVLHDRGIDDTATLPPRTLGELVLELSERNQGSPGDISVAFVTGADGRRRAIVDIPGTKSWVPGPVPDVTSVDTDVLAIAGHSTSYERGVFAALADAGVGRDTEVMLVGHSEGGIVAADAAIDAAASGRYRITHVVTAGSPVGDIAERLPGTVSMLCLENDADIVPRLDGVANPDRPNVITVREQLQHGRISSNHSLDESYEPIAVDAQIAGDPSVTAFLDSAKGFLSGQHATTHVYQVVRAI
jgi:hypothetical protein